MLPFLIKYNAQSLLSPFLVYACVFRFTLSLHICLEKSSALLNLTASLVLLVCFPYIILHGFTVCLYDVL